jgi:hypothetical protein
MKKIALIFTIVCAGQLYGMEPGHYTGLGDLPREVQSLIITYLHNYDNLDDMITAITEASKGVGLVNNQLYGILNEQLYGKDKYTGPKEFTALIGMLQSKFPTNRYRNEIAKKFNTPAAEKYMELNGKFIRDVINEGNSEIALKKAQELLDQGVDPNFSWHRGSTSLLREASNLSKYDENWKAIHKLLLDYGANPEQFKQAEIYF